MTTAAKQKTRHPHVAAAVRECADEIINTARRSEAGYGEPMEKRLAKGILYLANIADPSFYEVVADNNVRWIEPAGQLDNYRQCYGDDVSAWTPEQYEEFMARPPVLDGWGRAHQTVADALVAMGADEYRI